MRCWIPVALMIALASHATAAAEVDVFHVAQNARATAPFRVAAAAPFKLPASFKGLTEQQAEARLIAEHPSAFMVYGGDLLEAGRVEDALLMYLVGMFRYGFYTAVNAESTNNNAELDAMFPVMMPLHQASLDDNRMDPKRIIDRLGRVLAWDAAHDNRFTSKTKYAAEYQKQRAEMEKERQKALEVLKSIPPLH
jgi:hypothetical protein